MANRVVDLPLHITKLESPEGFSVWELEMQQYLIATSLWEWTNVENKDAPTTEIPALATDSSNQDVRTTAPTALEEKILLGRADMRSCRDAADYIGQFKSIYNDILSIHPKLQLEENYLIFRFHTGLGKKDYVNNYTWTHEAIKDDKPAYSLEYAITGFLQTVRNKPDKHRNKRSRNERHMYGD